MELLAGAVTRSWAHRSGVAMLCLCLVSGCTLGPDYARPKVATPAAYRFDQTDVTSAAMAADAGLRERVRRPGARQVDPRPPTTATRIATARVDEFWRRC